MDLNGADVMRQREAATRNATDAALSETWRDHQRYLLDISYRMLGSLSEAEDIVQEAFTRLLRVELDEIDDVRGWLVVVVSRLCLDQLRSARSRREVYVGPWLPEPLIPPAGGETDPADKVTLDDSVRMALLVVLERLSPAERAAFVLHDVFQFSFDDIASIVDRSPAACRQLASRARRHVKAETSPARFTVDPTELQRVTDQFITAAMNGDMDALLQVLDPNVISHTDTGGIVPAGRHPIAGRDALAKLLLTGISHFKVTLVPVPVNGEPGALAYRDGQLYAVLAFNVRNGRITQVHSIANPYKLAFVKSTLEALSMPT